MKNAIQNKTGDAIYFLCQNKGTVLALVGLATLAALFLVPLTLLARSTGAL